MQEEIYIGIDPGTNVTGYGIIKKRNNSYLPLDFGAIVAPKKEKLEFRYLYIYEEIKKIICSFPINALSIETQFVHKNVASSMKVSMARSVICLAATKKNIPIYEYAPKKAKKAVTGSGSASKEQVQRMIQILLNLKELPTPEDASDALSLAICHAHYSKFQGR